MDTDFNLKNTGKQLIIGLVILGLINIIITVWSLKQIAKNEHISEKSNATIIASEKLQYHIAQIEQFITDASLTSEKDGFEKAKENALEANNQLNFIASNNPNLAIDTDKLHTDIQQLITAGKTMVETYIDKGQQAGNELMKQADTGFDARTEKMLNDARSLASEIKKIDSNIVNRNAQHINLLTWSMVLINLLTIAAIGYLLMRAYKHLFSYLGAEPAQIRNYAEQISLGNFNNQIPSTTNKNLLSSLSVMQNNLSDNLEKINLTATEGLRIKAALDAVPMSLRIADKDGNLVYLNAALINTLKRSKDEWRKKIPDFDADNLLGKSAGIFYDDSQTFISSLKNLRLQKETDMVVGGRNLKVILTPILNANGELEGTVGQWIDKTDELRTQAEMSQLVNAAAVGDLSHRINLEGKTDFFYDLGESINQMLVTTDSVISETVSALERIANGDMTHTIDTEYQGTYGVIKDNANLTVARLTDIVTQIKSVAGAINVSASEISAGNIDLSQRTEEQASSLEETASSMEQMASTVKQNAENAKQANMMANEASEVAIKGGQVVGEVIYTMEQINASSKKIVDIISVIDGIAFQTNILALNAAVEAARAGEQGRGFAVVAAEVRSLAQRSAAAAKEIKQLIGDSVDKVAGGTKLVEEAGKTMDEIVSAVKLVTDIVNEIAAASQEQSAGIDQVNNAITNMDEVTQQNAALVEQAAAAANSMEQQTQSLIDSVAVFKLNDVEEPSLMQMHAPKAITSKSGYVAQKILQKPTEKSAENYSEKYKEKYTGKPRQSDKSSNKKTSKTINTPNKDDDWEEF
jgi:methyl-accepting chemotaxis protein